jgi:hypothetical protein
VVSYLRQEEANSVESSLMPELAAAAAEGGGGDGMLRLPPSGAVGVGQAAAADASPLTVLLIPAPAVVGATAGAEACGVGEADGRASSFR